MASTIDINALQSSTLQWIETQVWTPESAVQIALILSIIFLAYISQKAIVPNIRRTIEAKYSSGRIRNILQNLTRLVFPSIALTLLFINVQILSLETLAIDTTLSISLVKLLTAWIIIRLFVQFINNNFVRNLVALTVWSITALSIFGILDNTTAALDAFGMDLGEFRLSALTIIKGIIALCALLYIASLLASLLDKQLDKVTSLNASSRVLISKVTRVFLVTLALLIGVTTAGIDLSLLAVFSGAVGLGIGFGLQKGISNLFSGMLLLLDQSIKPGDIIEIEGAKNTFGWVNHLGARYTELVTRDNKSFLVPNEDFITQKVINWSHGNTLIRVETKFGVHYNSNPHEIKRIAEEAALVPERIVSEPAPVCHLVEFGDSSLNFVLRFWIKDAEKGVTNMRGAVMLALWDAFQENDIVIPYPHREVFLHEPSASKTQEAA